MTRTISRASLNRNVPFFIQFYLIQDRHVASLFTFDCKQFCRAPSSQRSKFSSPLSNVSPTQPTKKNPLLRTRNPIMAHFLKTSNLFTFLKVNQNIFKYVNKKNQNKTTVFGRYSIFRSACVPSCPTPEPTAEYMLPQF